MGENNPTYHGLKKKITILPYIPIPCYHLQNNCKSIALFDIYNRRNKQELTSLLPRLIFTAIRRNGQENYYFYQ